MNCMDPLPHLRTCEDVARDTRAVPGLQASLQSNRGLCVSETFWHAEDEHGERERKAGYLTFDKLTCILCFVNDEESGHC